MAKKSNEVSEYSQAIGRQGRHLDERSIRRQARDLGVPNFLIRLVGSRQASRLAAATSPENGYD